MNFFIVLTFFAVFFAAMAIGLIIKNKVLQKGCSMSPEECACRQEGKDPSQCEEEPAQKQQ